MKSWKLNSIIAITLYGALGLGVQGSTFTTFDPPGAGTVPFQGQGTQPASINSVGAITGTYIDASNVNHGFLRNPNGTFATFKDARGAGTGPGQGTIASSINSVGAITGQYFDANYVSHGFVTPDGKTFTTFDARGAGTGPGQGTQPASINDLGAITGFYVDANYVNHGFLRTP
jgi:hypothetical protein